MLLLPHTLHLLNLLLPPLVLLLPQIASRPSEALSYNISGDQPDGAAIAAAAAAAAAALELNGGSPSASDGGAAAAAAGRLDEAMVEAASDHAGGGDGASGDLLLREAQLEMEVDGPVSCPQLHGTEEAAKRAEAVAAAAHIEPFVPPGKVGIGDGGGGGDRDGGWGWGWGWRWRWE